MEISIEAKVKWNILGEKMHDRNAETFKKPFDCKCWIAQSCKMPPDKSCGQNLKIAYNSQLSDERIESKYFRRRIHHILSFHSSQEPNYAMHYFIAYLNMLSGKNHFELIKMDIGLPSITSDKGATCNVERDLTTWKIIFIAIQINCHSQ